MLCMPSYLMTLHVDANEMLTQLLNNTISFSDNNVTILKPLIKTVIIIFFSNVNSGKSNILSVLFM